MAAREYGRLYLAPKTMLEIIFDAQKLFLEAFGVSGAARAVWETVFGIQNYAINKF